MKRATLIVIATALFCLAFATAAYAGTITGVVKDINTGAGISGASVGGAVTNSSGAYTLTGVSSGTQLQCSKSGYLQTWQVATFTGSSGVVNWALTKNYGTQKIPANSMAYTVFAWNDLGMHCDQDSYKYLAILPPYNTLHVQVKDTAKKTKPLTDGFTVTYSFAKKTNSTLHTDFWTYASNFGWNVAPNMGITGNGLSGTMKVDSAHLGFVADGIPITPYDDDGTWDPYGTASVTVKQGSTVVQTANVVAPVSTEMNCSNCHGANSAVDILTKHDSMNATTLLADANAGHPHLCSECHADNALGKPGKAGVESLSLAMHQRHAGKVTNDTAGCYNCHPGTKTACLRGIMFRAGKGCVDCHGTVAQLASSIVGGRQPWLQEPKCVTCHGSGYGENSGQLYRNSLLNNAKSSTMNGSIYCEACHNGTHAEYTTNVQADTSLTQKFQGDNYWIWSCELCHQNRSQGPMHAK